VFNRKHRFSLFNSPTYGEIFEFSDDRRIFIAMVLKTAKSLGWQVVRHEKNLLRFRSTEKRSSNAWITIHFEDMTKISVQSETIVDQRWDFGKNYLRVRDFKKLVKERRNRLTVIDERNIIDTDENLLGFYDYKIPQNFGSLLEKKSPTFLYILIYCGLLIVTLGVLFGYLSYLELFVLTIREVIFTFSLWFAVYFGAKHGNLFSFKILTRIALIAFICFYLVQFIVKQGFILSSEFNEIELADYFTGLINELEEAIVNRFGQKIIIFGVLGLLVGSFFFSNLRTSISKLKKSEISEDVLTYTEYLVAKGTPNYQIKKELTRKGISDYRLHNQILEAIRPDKKIIS